MKQVFLFIVCLLFSHLAPAQEYNPNNKVIRVVIPQPPASGLTPVYFAMADFAKRNKINMIPVYKPGANGYIGIDYAGKEKNDGDTLLLSTISDYVGSNLTDRFDNVSAIVSAELTLVASKKSKISTLEDIINREKLSPGQLVWSYSATAQESMIDDFIKFYKLDKNKVNKMSMGTISVSHLTSLVSGDLDLAFLLTSVTDSLSAAEKLTVINIDPSLKEKIFVRKNAVAIFLPKNSSKESIDFWGDFIQKFLNDTQSMEKLSQNSKMQPGPDSLNKILVNWKK